MPLDLTAAERVVLDLLRSGLTNRAMAELRGTSTHTVANQVSSLLRKTRSPSRRALLATVGTQTLPIQFDHLDVATRNALGAVAVSR